MRFFHSFFPALVLLSAGAAQAATSWGFGDASISISSKKSTDNAVTEKLSDKTPLASPVALGATDALKLTLTAKENGKGKRPHQAFLLVQEQDSGLETPFAMDVKESGKAKVEISQKDLPVQLLLSTKPLRASVVVASFGSAQGINTPVFDLEIKLDPNTAAPAYEKPLRYGKAPEIHHIFRADPRSPPMFISLVFLLAVLATVPGLFVAWLLAGANLGHLQKAIAAAPISHAAFFGSIVAMEGVFFMYYSSWNLFQTLPAAGVVGAVTFLSGMKALGEVQSRRLAGER